MVSWIIVSFTFEITVMFKALELTWLLLVLLNSCQFSLELKSNLAKAFLLILYCSRQGAIPLCQEGHEVQSYYKPLVSCISGTMSKRWTPIQDRSSSSQWNSSKLEVHGKYCSIILFFFSIFSVSLLWRGVGLFLNVLLSLCLLDLLRPFNSVFTSMTSSPPPYWYPFSLQEFSLMISLKTYRFGDQLWKTIGLCLHPWYSLTTPRDQAMKTLYLHSIWYATWSTWVLIMGV